MTAHLSYDEIVDAIDGRLQSARAGHLESCAACRREVDGLAATLVAVSAMAPGMDVPDPPDALWAGVKARVRGEVRDHARSRGWMASWGWQALAASLVAVAVASAGFLSSWRSSHLDVASSEPAWADVVKMADALSSDDVQGFATSVAQTTLIDDLTPDERAAFAALIQAELGAAQ